MPTGSAISLESIPMPAALLDSEGRICAGNQEWSQLTPDLYQSDTLQAGIAAVLNGNAPTFCHELADGGCRYRLSVTPHSGGVLVLRQALESGAAAQSGKMETAGRLLGGVSHDFANVLTMISGYCDILLGRVGDRDPIRPELDEIRKAANRGARLIEQLLGFTRGQTVHPVLLDLNEVINGIVGMVRPLIGEYIDLHLELSPDLNKILADRGQIEQVVLNLILNARDAMPQGGKISIETYNSATAKEAADAYKLGPDPCVMLSIRDTGHGMDSEVRARLWDPFFTTKPEGKGTGLGLSTVRRIINESHGEVWVDSTPGQGSTFMIALPIAKGVVGPVESRPQALASVSGRETVLVVEDEDGVRHLLTQVLERKGYRVLEACNGEQALQIYQELNQEIDLVLTDIIMPKMGGRTLAEEVRRIKPAAKIVFMSGYTDDVISGAGPLGPGTTFLQKPLRWDTLAARVRDVLDSSS